MKATQLARLTEKAICHVHGWQEASNDAHRAVLAALIRGIDNKHSMILCEPSLVRSTHRPPDIVLVCPVGGLHVLEVKGISLEDIDSIAPGGQFVIKYAQGSHGRNPFAQVRNAMFDIRDVAQRVYAAEFNVPFSYWVIMPRIKRSEWLARWGESALAPEELLFAEDLRELAIKLTGLGKARLSGKGWDTWPAEELVAISKAFGDSSVLFPQAEERQPRRTRESTLGELFDEAADTYKALSDEQQLLSTQFWERGPRVIRGVAGSGKTIVLANNLARRIERFQKQSNTLFSKEDYPLRVLAVCFNRTLVPFLEKKISIAYQQRTGGELPAESVDVFAYNGLMWHLSKKGMWRYHKIDDLDDDARATNYLRDLEYVKLNDSSTFDRNAYDAIYVDEGQDFAEVDVKLLSQLCRSNQEEPSLFVFYDDAQNLYGRSRPNWQSLGLNVVGSRSHIMTQCFRNTRPIVESSFNVLYGSFAKEKAKVPTKAFGDLSTLIERKLLVRSSKGWQVGFACREGLHPEVQVFESMQSENEHIRARVRWLIEDQEVRPQDILVLAFSRERIRKIAKFVEQARIPGVDRIHIAFEQRDEQLGKRGCLTFSTVASAKGYDAYCVLLASANSFPEDVRGRASFYVGCTRAIELLEVSGYADEGLLREFLHGVNLSANG